jgi:hypothetical protein
VIYRNFLENYTWEGNLVGDEYQHEMFGNGSRDLEKLLLEYYSWEGNFAGDEYRYEMFGNGLQ